MEHQEDKGYLISRPWVIGFVFMKNYKQRSSQVEDFFNITHVANTKNNKKRLGGISTKNLVEKYGSPIYVYEAETIRNRYRQLVKNIKYPQIRVYYALKANANPEILKTLRELGSGLETVSTEEIKAGLKAGFKPKDIIFTCSSLSQKELEYVIRKEITINIDSLSQLEKYGKLRPNTKVSLRLNLHIGAGHHEHVITGGPKSKFGIYYTQIPEALELAQQYGLRINGLHQHIGSHILEPKMFMQAMNALLKYTSEFPDLEFIDLGGGLGVPYEPKDKPLDLKKLGERINTTLKRFSKKHGREIKLLLEPGRFLVAESGTLLCTVTDVKRTPYKTFVGVDSGFNHLIRPAMYNSYHEITNVSRTSGKKEEVTVVGNICESGDVFGKERMITTPKEGDILAISNAGAYGFTMSSNYNLRKKPKEIIVEKGKSHLSKSA